MIMARVLVPTLPVHTRADQEFYSSTYLRRDSAETCLIFRTLMINELSPP